MTHARRRLAALIRTSLLGCLPWLALAAAAAEGQDRRPSLVVVADPQIHNVAGGSVKQTFVAADWVSKVAQRPPELNLLADAVFADLVGRADQATLGTDTGLVVLLGDGTNAGCTGEYDRFDARLAALRDKGKIVLWAHGNHDSYLMGTTNSYLPGDEDREALRQMAKSDKPVDLSWWKSLDSPLDREKAWNSLCVDGKGGRPINKGQWMARYLASFGKDLQAEPPERDGTGYTVRAHGSARSRLGAQNFQVRGRWVPPPYGTDSRQGNYLRAPYLSYLVQAIDVGSTHRLVLIDTSVCDDTGFMLGYALKNAGSRACVTQEELNDIRELAHAPGRRLVFGGHFPLHKLDEDTRRRVLEVFNAGDRPWSYLSGHTHSPESWRISEKGDPYSGSRSRARYDLNIGSTTDWPMEAHRVAFDDSERGMTAASVGYLGADRVNYTAPPSYDGWEICRHLKVAEKLAAVSTGVVFTGPWDASVTEQDYRSCEREKYTDSLAVLRKAMATIEDKMKDPAYREAMLRIAVSASEAENKKRWLGSFLVIP